MLYFLLVEPKYIEVETVDDNIVVEDIDIVGAAAGEEYIGVEMEKVYKYIVVLINL